MIRRFGVLLALMLVAACGTTTYPMPYQPTGPVAGARPPGPLARVSDVAVTRRTGREDPAWIGTIRGGYGNPLKALQADRPLDQVVRRALDDALAARGWLAQQDPRVDLLAEVSQFDANRYARLEATVVITLRLRERSSGRVLAERTERARNVTGSVLALDTGIFASPEELHALMLRTMNEAIDRLLDSDEVVAALAAAR
ncbi:hypothetical protein [Roseomonas sp. HF4]|uniref:hypothetical protein n=1 Tax=Roseomonas sp. HF4 TaxID=2562313 RepID=UPI0010C073A6|nr:hypothetical protein [Roseomonas sp. HF4]